MYVVKFAMSGDAGHGATEMLQAAPQIWKGSLEGSGEGAGVVLLVFFGHGVTPSGT